VVLFHASPSYVYQKKQQLINTTSQGVDIVLFIYPLTGKIRKIRNKNLMIFFLWPNKKRVKKTRKLAAIKKKVD